MMTPAEKGIANPKIDATAPGADANPNQAHEFNCSAWANRRETIWFY